MLTLFGYRIACADVGPTVLQLRHTLRLRRLAGLSALTETASLVSWFVWLLHAVLMKDGPLLVAATLGLAVALALAAVLVHQRVFPRPRQQLLIVGGYAAVFALMLSDPTIEALALATVDLFWFSPQLVSAYRNLDLSGISVRAYLWDIFLSLGWVGYTAASGFPAAGAWSAVSALLAGAVLRRVLLSRARPSSTAVNATSPHPKAGAHRPESQTRTPDTSDGDGTRPSARSPAGVGVRSGADRSDPAYWPGATRPACPAWEVRCCDETRAATA
jgi:uncharacterized protein with PQ loop repeat